MTKSSILEKAWLGIVLGQAGLDGDATSCRRRPEAHHFVKNLHRHPAYTPHCVEEIACTAHWEMCAH